MARTPHALLSLLVLVSTAGGCAGTATCDPAVEECADADTAAVFGGDVQLLQVDHGCCEPGEDRCPGIGAWWVDVVTQGAPPAIAFTLLEAGLPSSLRWSETHTVPATAADPDGYWTDHYLQLDISRTSGCSTLRDCADRFRAGENTPFACTPDLDAAGLQIVVQVLDDDGAELDCEAAGISAPDAPGCGS